MIRSEVEDIINLILCVRFCLCTLNRATRKNKVTGKTISTFSIVNDTHAVDGFAVSLKLPMMESNTMEVYREMNIPSPGKVYSPQVNGLITSGMTKETAGKGVYITEIRPNDVNRSSSYGTADDYMECLEIVNTTDKAVDLNKDFQLAYYVKEGTRKILPLYQYSSTASGNIGSSSNCTVPAGGTAVIWCFRKNTLSGYTSFPTLSNFRSAYGISSSTPVYIFTAQASMNNVNRGFELYSLNADGSWKEKVSSYCYLGAADCPDNTSAILKINPEGPEMILHTAAGTSTMGTVDSAQTTFTFDNGDFIELHLPEGGYVPASIKQGQDLRVKFYYEFNSAMPRLDTIMYYRPNGTGSWIRATEGGIRVPNIYEGIISGDVLFDLDFVEFYIIATNPYRSSVCGVYTVKIDKLNDVDGVRTNIQEGQVVRGTVAVTGNNGGSNSDTKVYIDGTSYSTTPMLEGGAYLSFYADGRDAGSCHSITTTGNKQIANISKWIYEATIGQVIHIDSSYFTYSSSSKKYTTTLRFWSGTFGADVDDYLCPSANRDDYTVTNIKLKLPNGKSYLPTKIGPSSYGGVDTSGKTNLSTAYDAVHRVGDSTNWCPYMDVTFTVPAADVNAVGVSLDTTKLSNGSHTVKVTSGSNSSTVNFIVDNAAPSVNLGVSTGATVTGCFTISPTVTDNHGLKSIVTLLDDKEISTPYSTSAFALGKGSHTLKVIAVDQAGNQTTSSAKFTVSDVSMTLGDVGAADITNTSANLYLTVQSGSAAQSTFYKAERIDAANIQTSTAAGILPHIQYTIATGDVSDTDEIIINWSGTASNQDDTHANTLFVQNVTTGSWDRVATADQNGNIQNAVFTAKDHISGGKATILVQCTADSALPDTSTTTDGKTGNNAGWNGNGLPADYDFSFAWVSDTQGYAQRYQKHFVGMNQWIVDNAESRKIKYVIHTGDIVDDWDHVYQWENADVAMKILDDAGMPYGVLGGNHDVASTLDDREAYYQYFGEDRVKNQPTFGGSFENNYGHYDLISENGQDFIIVYMSWNIYEDEINWMNEVLAEHSDRKAILCFHAYTHIRESVDGLLDYYGAMVQKRVVKQNPNVFAVLSGHYSGSTYQTVMFDDNGDGVKERTVYQICTDYQSVTQGGMQYIKFLYFDLDNDKVYMNSYSPYYDEFNYYDDNAVADLAAKAKSAGGVASGTDIDKMILSVNFDTTKQTLQAKGISAYISRGEEFGTAQVNTSTGRAEVAVSELDAETNYAWYAVTTNADSGYARHSVNEFTTLANPKVTGMEISQLPAKLSYFGKKDALDVTGGKIKLYFDNQTTKEINMTADMVSGFHNTVAGKQTLTVTYETFTSTFEVEITTATVTFKNWNNTVISTDQYFYGDPVTVPANPSRANDANFSYTFKCWSPNVTVCTGNATYTAVFESHCLHAGKWNNGICSNCGAACTHNYAEGVCTICGSADPDYVAGSISLSGVTLSLEDEVLYNLYFTTADMTVSPENMGLLVWDSEPANATITGGATVIPGATVSGSTYMVQTEGIPGKNLGDTLYLVAYARLDNGAYVYSKVLPYSAKTYCMSRLEKSSDANLKALCVALLNYGAAAQEYFAATSDYTYTTLMNADLTAEQQGLVQAYNSGMMAPRGTVTAEKAGSFGTANKGYTARSVSMSADGIFSINYYFTTANPTSNVTMYYWTEEDFNAVSTLTAANATGSKKMTPTGTPNQFWANIDGIAAKDLDKTIYVCGVYSVNGSSNFTGVIPYSLGYYCSNKAENGGAEIKPMAAATAVYSYYAKLYFNV